ncbi:MAG: hypothetical protein JXQ71_03705 [Verrucomicrobia bacterium]|nr:hypothetical protein [Verrucomicrobiota bacterium]
MLIFALVLVVCSVMVIRQINLNQGKHLELREAFILLYTKGYQPQAQRLFNRLLDEVDNLSNRQVLDDFQRTLTLVNPLQSESNNLVWQYHWTVSKEVERRSWTTLERALKLADQE